MPQSRDRFLFFCKKWAVEGSKDSDTVYFFKYKNARTFAEEMNKWSEDFFNGEVFTVRRING
jgi:hypothetical protein